MRRPTTRPAFNFLSNATMKISPALRSLAIAFRIPVISQDSSAMRLARPIVGQTQLTPQNSPFSTTAKLQARDSKRPRKDPRISPSPPNLLLSTKLNVRTRSSDTLPSPPPSYSSPPPLLPLALPSSLDHPPCGPIGHAP